MTRIKLNKIAHPLDRSLELKGWAPYLKEAKRRRYRARVVALTSYEILNDHSKILDKEFREYVLSRIGEEGLTTIKTLTKQLSVIKKDHFDILKEIRNNSIAHKDASAINQANIIEHMKPTEIYNIGYSIFMVQQNMIKTFVNLLAVENDGAPTATSNKE